MNQNNKQTMLGIENEVVQVAERLSIYNKILENTFSTIREDLAAPGNGGILPYTVKYWLPVVELINGDTEDLKNQLDQITAELHKGVTGEWE